MGRRGTGAGVAGSALLVACAARGPSEVPPAPYVGPPPVAAPATSAAPPERVELRRGANPSAAPAGSPRVTATPEPSYPSRYDYPADACDKRHYCWCDDRP